MKLITYNINGVRAGIRKGFLEFIDENSFDVICLQEVKALEKDVNLAEFESRGYTTYWCPAEKKGYSGVAVLTKQAADKFVAGIGDDAFDKEGRVIRLDLGPITLFNIYFPSGTSGEIRQDAKYQFLDAVQKHIDALRKERPNIIVCGDFNICHQAIDIHDPIRNVKSSGFLPDERSWMDQFFEKGFIDCFRTINKKPDQYTWWSYRANARANNKGWRIDYVTITERMQDCLMDSQILKEAAFSDHVPVEVKFNLQKLPD